MDRRGFLKALAAGVGAASLGLPLQNAVGVPAATAIPVGTIFAKYCEDGIVYVCYDGGGWLPCDGRMVSKARYQELFAVIGSIYGGADGEFGIPDLRAIIER